MGLAQALDASGRALLVLAAAFDSPVADSVEHVTREPVRREIDVDGVPASLYSPAGSGRWPALVLLNGATERGRHHPRVVRLSEALARSGHLVLVPDVPGIARGEVTGVGLEATVACALTAERVALLGVSVGTTLGLLAAEDDRLRGHVSVVAGLTGYTDLADLIRLATTGTYLEADRIQSYPAGPFLSLCVARSVCTILDPSPARDRMASALDVPANASDPLAGLRGLSSTGTDDADAALALLTNPEAERFDELYAALPECMRLAVERLSPVSAAAQLRVPVELLVDPHDKYFPLEHARALARAAPSVRLTVTEVLSHADSRFSWRHVHDGARLAGFVHRSLRAARFG
jgi:pimeloyl-ACP methyl ester carboxylesterase